MPGVTLGQTRFIATNRSNIILRIVRSNAPLAERILGKIQDLAEAFRTLGNKEARAEYKRLKTAESLFMRAIENAGLVYQENKIKKAIEEMAREEQENGEVENVNEDAGNSRSAIDPDLLDFVDSVSAMNDKKAISKRKHLIGKISAKHAKIIERVLSSELDLDVNLAGYTVNIDGSAVKHIEEKHGENGTSDHSMAKRSDVASIGWAVNNADSGYIARTQTGAIDYSTQYRNADGSPSPKVIIEKSIGNGKIVVAECVPDTEGKKSISLVRVK